MNRFTREDLATLLAPHREPCVTICLPTHRRLPDAQQDPIRYRNLLKQAVARIEELHGRRADGVPEMIAKLESLGNGPEAGTGFWNRQRDGLAVFASPEHFSWHSVAVPLREITVVADSFHVKPLLPLLYDEARYQVLAVSREAVRLFEGDREEIEEIRVDGVPATIEEALGEEWSEHRDALRFHGTRDGAAGGRHFHRGGGSEREVENEVERFLRVVDQAVTERVSRASGLPLILCALDEYHATFRAVSKNPQLVAEGIAQSPVSLSSAALRDAAWAIFEPVREARVRQALEDVGAAVGQGQGSRDVAEIARAVVHGQVRRLLLQERHRVWGRIDRETGAVTIDGVEGGPEGGAAGAVDLLDELAELTLARGGDVILVPADRMPVPGGAAAAYRY